MDCEISVSIDDEDDEEEENWIPALPNRVENKGMSFNRATGSGGSVTQVLGNENRNFSDGQVGKVACVNLTPINEPKEDEEEDGEEDGEDDGEEDGDEDEEENASLRREEVVKRDLLQLLQTKTFSVERLLEALNLLLSTSAHISALLNETVSEGFNREYNLYCLDEELIPECIKKKYADVSIDQKYKKIRSWINPNVFCQTNWTFEYIEELNESCYILACRYPASIPPAHKFIWQLCDKTDEATDNHNMAAMIIIPVPDTSRALVYTVSRALSTIMNKYAIMKQWGLKLVASKDLSSEYIKALKVSSQHKDKRKTKLTESSLPESIGGFSPVAGAELFEHLRLKRKNSKATIEGSTKFEFRLRKRHNSKKLDKQRDLKTLIDISLKLDDIFQKNEILPAYEDYIAKEVNEELAENLDKQLVDILKGDRRDYYKHFFHLNRDVFTWQKNKDLSDSHDDIRFKFLNALHVTMSEDGASLESSVKFNYDEGKINLEEPVFLLLVANAFEYNGNSFNYTAGKWYQIPASRFPYIRTAITDDEIKYNELGLIPWTEEHKNKIRPKLDSEDSNVMQGERNYNIDATKKLNEGSINPRTRGIICDGINTKYRATNNDNNDFTFEFADIVTANTSRMKLGESTCIIHVKRKSAKKLAEQCFQLMRTVEYLQFPWDKERIRAINQTLLQGCLNTLYAKHDLPMITKFVHVTDAELTHSVVPIKWESKKRESNDQAVTNIMESVKQHCTRKEGFQQAMSTAAPTFITDNNLNIKNVDFFVISMNALFYCDEKGIPVTVEEAAQFCYLVQHFVRVAELFTKARHKTLYFILAIIQDGNKRKNPDPEESNVNYFTNQDLLTVEVLKRTVESAGFKFKWTVIESNLSESKKDDSSPGSSKKIKVADAPA